MNRAVPFYRRKKWLAYTNLKRSLERLRNRWEWIILNVALTEQYARMWKRQGPVADCCEHGDEQSVFTKRGKLLDSLCDYQLLKQKSAPDCYRGRKAKPSRMMMNCLLL